MLKYENNWVTITCDKCGDTQMEPEGIHNERFFMSGWSMNPRAKKYIHVCYDCHSPAQKRATDFVIQKFPAKL
jgi:hypothetical protein